MHIKVVAAFLLCTAPIRLAAQDSAVVSVPEPRLAVPTTLSFARSSLGAVQSSQLASTWPMDLDTASPPHPLAQVGLGSGLAAFGFLMTAAVASTMSASEMVVLNVAVVAESLAMALGVHALAEPKKNGWWAALATTTAGLTLLNTGNGDLGTALLTLFAIPPTQLILAMSIVN